MATLTIQPSGKDTILPQVVPTTNFGGLSFLQLGNQTGSVRRTPLQFPITWGVDIPAGSTINSAPLYLYYYAYYSTFDPVGRTIKAQRLLRLDWVELEATWNIYKAASNWSTAGADNDGEDYTSDDEASDIVPADYGWMDWDVLAQVQWAQINEKEIGFRMTDISAPVTDMIPYFYSKEETVATILRPKLVIEYTPHRPYSVGVIIG